MQLSPRYDGPTVLHIDMPVGDPSVPLLRQRRRLADTLAGLDDSQWSAPSRCEGWSVQDVVAHLVSTNGFWAGSMSAGLRGEPTTFLASFDPVATPAVLVGPMRELPPGDVLGRYVESLDMLAVALTNVASDAWSLLAEAPPGHIELQAVALHALWDAWTHERDIMVPLGLDQTLEDDEIRGSLVYAAAISPALLAAGGSTREGLLAVEAKAPDVSFVVDAGPVVTVRERQADDGVLSAELRGTAVDLIEGLTFRAPLVHDIDDDHQWLLNGLAEAFDVA